MFSPNRQQLTKFITEPTVVVLPFYKPWCAYAGVIDHLALTTYASGTWGAANQGIYIPFTTPQRVTVYKLGWVNGSAAGGNTDVGLYAGTTRMVSTGPTARVTNSATQWVDIADQTLDPGTYRAAMSHSATTANQVTLIPTASQTLGAQVLSDIQIEAGVGTLPATSASAVVAAVNVVPFILLAVRPAAA